MMIDKSWVGRTVLVTGATGFLGRHLVRRLTEAGAQVHATARRTPPEWPGVRWVPLDLGDAEALRAVVAVIAPDVVVHLGGRVSAAVDAGLVASTFGSLLGSSIALLDAAHQGQVGRLVLVGSTDEPRGGEVPTSPYGAAKGAMTAYARMYAESFDAPVVCVRPSEVFGPGQAPGKLLPYTAASVLRGVRPRLSSGRRRGDWVYVDDVIDGMLLAADRAPDGADLDLGTGELTRNREVVEGLLAALGTSIEPLWGALPDRPDEQERVADLATTERVLGWRPRIALPEGLQRTAEDARAVPVPVAG